MDTACILSSAAPLLSKCSRLRKCSTHTNCCMHLAFARLLCVTSSVSSNSTFWLFPRRLHHFDRRSKTFWQGGHLKACFGLKASAVMAGIFFVLSNCMRDGVKAKCKNVGGLFHSQHFPHFLNFVGMAETLLFVLWNRHGQ